MSPVEAVFWFLFAAAVVVLSIALTAWVKHELAWWFGARLSRLRDARLARRARCADWDSWLAGLCRDEGCLHRQPFDDLMDLAREVQEKPGGEGGS